MDHVNHNGNWTRCNARELMVQMWSADIIMECGTYSLEGWKWAFSADNQELNPFLLPNCPSFWSVVGEKVASSPLQVGPQSLSTLKCTPYLEIATLVGKVSFLLIWLIYQVLNILEHVSALHRYHNIYVLNRCFKDLGNYTEVRDTFSGGGRKWVVFFVLQNTGWIHLYYLIVPVLEVFWEKKTWIKDECFSCY